MQKNVHLFIPHKAAKICAELNRSEQLSLNGSILRLYNSPVYKTLSRESSKVWQDCENPPTNAAQRNLRFRAERTSFCARFRFYLEPILFVPFLFEFPRILQRFWCIASRAVGQILPSSNVSIRHKRLPKLIIS